MPVNHAKDITEMLAGHVRSEVGATLLLERLRSSATSLEDEFRVAVASGAAPELLVELLVGTDEYYGVVPPSEDVVARADRSIAAQPPPNIEKLLSVRQLWKLPDTVCAILEGRVPGLTLASLARAPDAEVLLGWLVEARARTGAPLDVDDVSALLACNSESLIQTLEMHGAPMDVTISSEARELLVRKQAWTLLRILSATDEDCTELLEHAATDHVELSALVEQHKNLRPEVRRRAFELARRYLADYGDAPAPDSARSLVSTVLHERLATSVDMFVDTVVQECHYLYGGSLPPEPHPTGSWRALTDLVNAREGTAPINQSFAPDGLFLRPGDLDRVRLRLMKAAKTNSALEQLLRHVARKAEPTSRDPQFGEFVELCWAMGDASRVQDLDGGPQWLAQHLDETLGNDRHRWETFFSLLNSWTLTLSELLETSAQITHNFDDQSTSPDNDRELVGSPS